MLFSFSAHNRPNKRNTGSTHWCCLLTNKHAVAKKTTMSFIYSTQLSLSNECNRSIKQCVPIQCIWFVHLMDISMDARLPFLSSRFFCILFHSFFSLQKLPKKKIDWICGIRTKRFTNQGIRLRWLQFNGISFFFSCKNSNFFLQFPVDLIAWEIIKASHIHFFEMCLFLPLIYKIACQIYNYFLHHIQGAVCLRGCVCVSRIPCLWHFTFNAISWHVSYIHWKWWIWCIRKEFMVRNENPSSEHGVCVIAMHNNINNDSDSYLIQFRAVFTNEVRKNHPPQVKCMKVWMNVDDIEDSSNTQSASHSFQKVENVWISNICNIKDEKEEGNGYSAWIVPVR